MKQLGPYKKWIVVGAVIQSIIVIIAGYLLFKSRGIQHQSPATDSQPVVERPAQAVD